MKGRGTGRRRHEVERDLLDLVAEGLETRWFMEYRQVHPVVGINKEKMDGVVWGATLYMVRRLEKLLKRPLTMMERVEVWDLCLNSLEKGH